MKTKKKLIIVVAIICVLVMCFGSMSVYAAYSYGNSYVDYVSTTSMQSLGTHYYTHRDIGAEPINVTAPSGYPEQEYYLRLFTYQNGVYKQYGYRVKAGTATLGGSYYWLDANPTTVSFPAYIHIEKITSGSISLGGSITSTSRTWQ